MADTKFHHAEPADGLPVQPDGVSFSGIIWFAVILTVTTFFCAGLVWGMLRVVDSRFTAADPSRSPVALPAGTAPPGPVLLTDERGNLTSFREHEDAALASYEWIDQSNGIVRIPISRAKDLLLERGLPAR